MNLHSWLAERSSHLWPLVANHLWQSTVFLVIVFLTSIALKSGPARSRYSVLLLGAIKLAVPSAILFLLTNAIGIDPHAIFGGGSGGASSPIVSQITEPIAQLSSAYTTTGDTPGRHSELPCVLSIVWAAGFAGVLGTWQLRRRRMIASIRRGRSIVSGREAEALTRARKLLNVRRNIRLIILGEAVEPGVWGVFKPILVIPEQFCRHLDQAEIDAVMAHEVIHVKRWDNLTGNLNMLLCCAFWFHPLVWLLDRKLLSERERVCDESVVEMNIDSEVYASSILKVCRLCSGQELPGLSCAAGSNLRRRLEEIMSNTSKERSLFHRLLVGGAVISLAALSISAAMLGRVDQGAQSSGQSPEKNRSFYGDTAGELLDEFTGTITLQNNPDTMKMLAEAPEIPIEFKNADGAPLSIISARVKTVKIGQLRKKDKTGVESDDALDIFLAKTMLSLVNNTAKGVDGIAVELVNNDTKRRTVLQGNSVTIKAYGSISDSAILTRLVGDPTKYSLKVIGVHFDDSSTWGVRFPPPPPPPAPAGGDIPKIIRKSGGVLQGEAIKKVEPSYPEMAQAAQISGSVIVEITIDEQGKVESARSVSGHPLLRDAAVQAASKWEFKPTKLQGQPVKVIGTITFNFQM